LVSFRKELLRLSHACGLPHPTFVTMDQFEILVEGLQAKAATDAFNYQPEWSLPSAEDQEAVLAWFKGTPMPDTRAESTLQTV